MSYLALPASFEYLCYGSTTIRNICYSSSVGMDFDIYIRQILTSKVDPRAERIKPECGLEFFKF